MFGSKWVPGLTGYSVQISGPTKVNVEMLLESLRKEGELNMIGAQTLVLDSKKYASAISWRCFCQKVFSRMHPPGLGLPMTPLTDADGYVCLHHFDLQLLKHA